MAHLWVERTEGWGIFPLGTGQLLLTGDPASPVCQEIPGRPVRGAIHPAGSQTSEWVLLCRPNEMRVNGESVALGIRVLADRDEIVPAPGVRVFFSSERLAEVVPFPGSPQPTMCPRCYQAIADGEPSVRCPGCGVAYHESPDTGRACWTYAKCGVCGRDTSLDAGYRWAPDQPAGEGK
jgi:hypothetical protein